MICEPSTQEIEERRSGEFRAILGYTTKLFLTKVKEITKHIAPLKTMTKTDKLQQNLNKARCADS